MQHPFPILRVEYESLISTCKITRFDEVDEIVREHVLPNMPRYVGVGLADVHPTLTAGLHWRESSGNFKTYLGNGEPLNRVTRLVPKNRGPWFDPNAWEKGAKDALVFDHVNELSAPMSVAYEMWKAEGFNGFGPRAHGKHSGYLWAGTNVYTGGKYVADGQWSATEVDKQIGVVPIFLRLAQLAPQFAIPGMPEFDHQQPVPAPQPVPEGVGGGAYGAGWVQHALNVLDRAGLIEDGSYGRRTRNAVRAWQIAHNIRPFDGLVGPVTGDALKAALAA